MTGRDPTPSRARRRGSHLVAVLLWAGVVGAGPTLEQGGTETASAWIRERRAALPAEGAPAAEARFELAEEIAALRDRAALLPLGAEERRAMLALLAEAIELDPRWTAPALRLAAHAEADPAIRARIERMLRGVSGETTGGPAAQGTPLAESRFLAAYRAGRLSAAAAMRTGRRAEDLDALLSSPQLDLALDGGGERIRRDLATGATPLLRPEERRRLLEFDRARLAPETASFSGSAWLDGWAPLPEVDAASMASWLRAVGR